MDCSFNVLRRISESLELKKWNRELSSKFLKIRHNIFADCYMGDNEIAYRATDFPIRQLGIDSDLTPDIYLGLENGTHKFLEFFVTNNPEVALQNKKEKYDKFADSGVVVKYIYFDMRTMMCFTEPEQDYNFGYNLSNFEALMKKHVRMDRYLVYDSSELDMGRITPGKKYGMTPQNIYYTPIYSEYTNDEYMNSLGRIIMELSNYPDDQKCCIVFDCLKRKFSVRPGYKDPVWMIKAVKDASVFRDVIIYENYSAVNEEKVEGFKESSCGADTDGNEGHVLSIEYSGSDHDCLEPAMAAADFHKEAARLQFDGLYCKRMDCRIVSDQAEKFYEDWLEECRRIRNPKIKMTTMLALPDPDLIDSVFDHEDFVKKSTGWVKFAVSSINFSQLKVAKPIYSTIKSEFFQSLDKEIFNKYKEIEQLEQQMKVIRKSMSDAVGTNTMSYRIKLMNDFFKEMIRAGREVNPERFAKSKEFILRFSPNGLESEYAALHLRKIRLMRESRSKMKMKCSRTNMFTMDRSSYKEYKFEIECFLKKRKKGDERMGLYGFNGECRFEDVDDIFKNFWDYLTEDSTFFEDWFEMDIGPDSFPCTVAGEQCKDYYSFYKYCKEKIRKTRIYRILLWISNLARSVWAISTYKTKKRRVIFDRFGTRNCILFVASTGNIQKYKSSKAFKMIIPINKNVEQFCGYGSIPGCEIITTSDKKRYLVTHWSFLKIQHLKYFMELPGRWLQTIICIMSEYNIMEIKSDIYMYTTYCMLNARRKNENLLHDLKYMTYNMFGIRGCYSDLLADKFEIPRDLLQRYIEEKFLRNIPKFSQSLEHNELLSISPVGNYPSYRLSHPLADSEYGLDAFNLFVYSSYCFPKGVFTNSIEQTINMKSIMEIHAKAMSRLEDSRDYYSVKNKTDKSISEIFDCDLYYNSGVVSAVGLYCEHYICSRGIAADIRGIWAEIINSDITEYANSHGLRENDLSNSRSWGKKGHDVMTALISRECNLDNIQILESIRPETIKDASKSKWEIKNTRYRIRDYAANHNLENIELNNANKVQWGGSREIYIMTIGAKNIQWALEQMFAKLSRFLDNEFIHIPAANRFGKLYDNVKQKVSGIRYYLTLDCRKWAPLSNINKYIVFINSMSGVLPSEFVEDFNYFFDLYYRKRLFFKRQDVEMFLSLHQNHQYRSFFKESGDAYYIEMPYSFMMGMFNYLSSLLHAASQKYFEENIIPIIEREHSCKIKFVMFAHSDDSGGYVEISKHDNPEGILEIVLKEYEAFQKCLNHMFSLKKCTVGTSYFEITSYCFMKTDPMPVLSKFIYNHQINLTPAGYLADVKSISSAVMEMIANGASFRTCFLKYLILGNSYRKFCVGIPLNDTDSRLSLDLGGYPIIHPFYICVYKSLSEEKWLSEFKDGTFERNKHLESIAGMVDSWGVRRGLKVKMVTMKNRENDGRFSKFEILKEVPDEIIPSGHYACYMRKMSSKYYSDTMWYSMHDIDGTIIQSNLFNRGLAQSYYFMGEECSIIKLITLSKNFISTANINPENTNFPDYVTEIDQNIVINRDCSYKSSDVRPKPSEINTYYNSWWRTKTRETKIIALIKICPWMGVMISNPVEYIECLESSGYVDVPDLMNSLTEEEPLMKFAMTTKSESRIIDRFDTIASWLFHNAYPGMRPDRLKRMQYRHNLPRNKYHVECMCSIMFEALASGRAKKEKDMQIVEESNGVKTISPLMKWIQSRVSSDPLYSIVMGTTPSTWIDRIDFISLKNNQYSQYGRYWVGKTECICRISGRSYSLSVLNGAITEIRCKDQYQYESIEQDMRAIDRFGFRYSSLVSSHKSKTMIRITKCPDGFWKWTELAKGMPYVANVKLDPSICTDKRLTYIRDETMEKYREVSEEWAKFKLRYWDGQKTYRAYILHKKPCEKCLSVCKYSGHDFCLGEKIQYEITLSREELLNRWRETETYAILYREKMRYGSMFSEYASYMGQIGTYLSAAYIGTGKIGDNNFFRDYRGELSLESMAVHDFDESLINEVKTKLSKFVKFKLKSGRIVAKADSNKMKEILSEYGSSTMSTALALLPVERSIDYYSPMTYDDYWYNNAQTLPSFMQDFTRYIYSTLERQRGTMSEKRTRFRALLNEIADYLGYSYRKMVRNKYMSAIPVDLRLIAMIRSYCDVGECSNDEVDGRFYYDADSIIGCVKGWMRYILIYSHRRDGVLDDDHKAGYKREYLGFFRKFKSMCQTEFQINIQQTDPKTFQTFDAPPYQIEELEEDWQRVYPLFDCDYYDFECDPDAYDPDIMTYDRDESMESWEYNENNEYDFANESIFHDNGYRKRIRMCSEEDADNWIQIDMNDFVFELQRDKGKNNIGVRGGRFTHGPGSNQTIVDEREYLSSFNKESEISENLLQVMMTRVSEKETAILKEEGIIKRDASKRRYTVAMAMINALFVQHSIFSSVFDENGDLTPILERESYDDISNQSRPLNDNMFNQLSNAELEAISPGIISRMETNHYRMTINQYSQIKTIKNATRFKDSSKKYTFDRILASVIIVRTNDQFCEETSSRLYDILKQMGEQVNLTKDEQLPEPYSGDYNIPRVMRIGI